MNTVFVVLGILFYLAPYIVAACNPDFKQRGVMLFLNIVTGWLVVPWVGMMVWALWKTKAA